MAEEIRKVFGMNVRITDVYPNEIIGVNNGRFVTWFWQGAEVARIYPAPNTFLHWTASADCVAERVDESNWLANNHT